MKQKKILSLVLTVVLLIAMLPQTAFAADDSVPTKAVGNIQVYSQWDVDAYGDGGENWMNTSGCGWFTLGHILQWLGIVPKDAENGNAVPCQLHAESGINTVTNLPGAANWVANKYSSSLIKTNDSDLVSILCAGGAAVIHQYHHYYAAVEISADHNFVHIIDSCLIVPYNNSVTVYQPSSSGGFYQCSVDDCAARTDLRWYCGDDYVMHHQNTARAKFAGGDYWVPLSEVSNCVDCAFYSTSNSPSVTFVPWDDGVRTYIGETDASIGQEIYVTGGNCSDTGFVLYNTNGTVLGQASNGYYYYQVYFKINEELGVTLTPDTTYLYQFYAVVNGTTYWSDCSAFTTNPSSAVITASFSPSSKQNITPDEAVVARTLTVTGASIFDVSTVGIDIYDASGTWLNGKTELPNPDPNYDYLVIWYSLQQEIGMTLIPGAAYQYQFKAVIYGTTYYSDMDSFVAPASGLSVTFVPWENENYTYISETDACIGQEIYIYGGTSSDTGFVLYDNAGIELSQTSNGCYNYQVFFKITEDLGVILSPNSTYLYRFYAIVDGVTYWSDYGSFTTTYRSYTVHFNPSGGIVSPESKTVICGLPYGNLPTPTKSDCTFDGWFTSVSGGDQITSETVVTTASDHELYAHWTHVCSNGHDYVYSVAAAPSLQAAGLLAGCCSRCGETTTVTLPTLNTTDYSYTVIVNAACTADGLGRYTWNTTAYGSYFFDAPIPAAGHSYNSVVTAPTCTQNGYTTHTCSVCGESYTDTPVNPLGHNFQNGYCVRCGAADPNYNLDPDLIVFGSDLFAEPGGTFTVPIMVSGDTGFAGFTLVVNSDADLTLKKIEKGALLRNAEGMFTANVNQRTVNWIATEDIPGNGELLILTFELSDDVEDDTALTIGLQLKDNKPSNFANSDEQIVNVRFENITVTVRSVLPGDVNSDGEIDTLDAIRLAKYLVDMVTLTPQQLQAADVNQDGDITATDAIRLAKYLVGLIDTLDHTYVRNVTQSGDTPLIYAASVNAEPGAIVQVPVSISGNSGFAGFTFTIGCADELTLVNIERGSLLQNAEGMFTKNIAQKLINWTASEDVVGDGELLILTFEVSSDAADGDYAVMVTLKDGKAGNFANQNEQPVDVSFSPGAVTVSDPSPFTDVSSADYYYDAVCWACQVNPRITAGTSDTTFSPNQDCTRAQIVTFLWRAMGSPEPTADELPFNDVPANAYYCKAVLWAVENEITAGTSSTSFSPNSPCTRAQAVTFLWRASGHPTPSTAENVFSDISADGYYYQAVLWAVENEITAGTGEAAFSPNQSCKRAQIVTFLYKWLAD